MNIEAEHRTGIAQDNTFRSDNLGQIEGINERNGDTTDARIMVPCCFLGTLNQSDLAGQFKVADGLQNGIVIFNVLLIEASCLVKFDLSGVGYG